MSLQLALVTGRLNGKQLGVLCIGNLNNIDPSGATQNLMNGLTGVMTHLGNLRNTLGDAHGKGVLPPAVSESMAELAMNTAAILSTMIVRRFNQVKDRGQDG